MGKPKSKSTYNDDALCEDIARGELTNAQIAAKHGLSEVMVGQVGRGERRPELQETINAIEEGMLAQARRLGSRLAGVAMGRLGQLVAQNSDAGDETKRKAAVDIIKFACGDPSAPQTNINQTQGPPGLTPEQYAIVSEMEGGPK